MNFILTALGSAGDVHPFAGLGQHLRRRGHHVTLLANPVFRPLIEKLDLEFVPLGTADQYEEVLHNPDVWHPYRAFRVIVEFGVKRAVRPVYEAIAARYVAGKTVVAAHALDFGARIAQDKLGVPVASTFLAPVVFRSTHLPPVVVPGLTGAWTPPWAIRLLNWLTDVTMADRLLGPPINALRRELQLPPVRRILQHWWFSPTCVIGLFPDWFAPPQADWPRQTTLVGFPLWDESGVTEVPDELETFLQAGSPPIVFTPGSAMVQGRDFFAAAVDACRLLGRRGILLTRYPRQLPPELPAGVRHFDYVPLSRVLPGAAALVYHGGIGTLAQGLAAGVPQLVMNMAHDQHDNAQRLKRLGVGASLRPRKFRGPAVARALDELLAAADVRAQCRQLAARMKQTDALQHTCDLLERLA
ncbi:MAG: glycosyltransferase [Planctomycetia bacterium]|nr:MAG: glycosyltransferase [Planctomycetia bacterium]